MSKRITKTQLLAASQFFSQLPVGSYFLITKRLGSEPQLKVDEKSAKNAYRGQPYFIHPNTLVLPRENADPLEPDLKLRMLENEVFFRR